MKVIDYDRNGFQVWLSMQTECIKRTLIGLVHYMGPKRAGHGNTGEDNR